MINVFRFIAKDSEIFSQALTHSSYSKNNYERLEFLGDSILNFVVGDYLFRNLNYDEGCLTKARSNLVSKAHLSLVFESLNLDNHVRIGKSLDSLTNNIKCDMFESIVGAIYLESGLDNASEFILSALEIDSVDLLSNDYKSLLQEKLQSLGLSFKYDYKILKDKSFVCTLTIDNRNICNFSGHSKADAAQQCAKFAYEKF